MKIRYYHQDNPGTRCITKEFDPNGKPLKKFRLAIEKDGKVLTGNALLAELQKPLYPDVPFSIRLPNVRPPQSHFDWVYVEHQEENFVITMRKEWVQVWDVTEGEYLALKEAFTAHLKQYLKVAEEYYLPSIPDGDGYVWELVDMTKPYRERYTEIPVEKGKYKGNFYVLTYGDNDDIFEYLTEAYGQSKNPVVKLVGRTI